MGALRFDASDVDDLARDLGKAATDIHRGARAVVQRGALNIKRDAARRLGTGGHLRHLGRAVTYDTQETLTRASAEIGPDKNRRQGKLGHIPEYGTRNNRPRPYLAPALEAERPRFARALEAAGVKALPQ